MKYVQNVAVVISRRNQGGATFTMAGMLQQLSDMPVFGSSVKALKSSQRVDALATAMLESTDAKAWFGIEDSDHELLLQAVEKNAWEPVIGRGILPLIDHLQQAPDRAPA